MILERKSIEYNADLVSTIGYRSDVTNLSINNIKFGNANGNAIIELSNDRELLTVYTEDKYLSVAKIFVDKINIMSFVICEEKFTFRL